MASVMSRIKSLMKLGKTSRETDDSGTFPVQQVTYMGKVCDAVMWLPYGFHANIPEDQLAVLLSMQGNPEARIALPGSPLSRPRLETPGDMVVFHPQTQSRIHFKSDGSIEIISDSELKVSAPDAQFTGDVVVDGSLSVNGLSATLPSIVTSGLKDISDTHAHSGVQAGGANTGPPV